MKTFNGTMGQAEQMIGELRQATKPLADKAGKILENVEQGSEQFNKAMADARELIKAIGLIGGDVSEVHYRPVALQQLERHDGRDRQTRAADGSHPEGSGSVRGQDRKASRSARHRRRVFGPTAA